MRPLGIELKRDTEKYDIVIGHGSLKEIGVRLKELNLGHHAVVITNPVIKQNHGPALTKALEQQGFDVDCIEVPSGEASKSAQTAFEVIHRIADKQASREMFIIAFGGGVVGDLSGYVAAAYKRGVPYVQVPTTFLAQIDSAIGGKVGIDLPFGKNLVGAFYHPRIVFTDVALLDTLDRRQIQAGLAEAVKYGVICDKNLFELIESRCDALLGLDEKLLTDVVYQCSRIKASIVSRDEREDRGMRTILNFGHTIGHAIESAARYEEYNHGEAVALGMRVVAEMSLKMNLVKQDDVDRLNELLSHIGLPEMIEGVDGSVILDRMRHDKKFRSGKNRFVLMSGIGQVKVSEDVGFRIIEQALERYLTGQNPDPDSSTQGQLF